MELLLDPGAGGTLRGLRDEEPDVGAVHLPETVGAGDVTETDADSAGARAAMEALLARRRQLAARMILPAWGVRRPR